MSALPPELEAVVATENPFFRSSQPYAPSPISIPGMSPQTSAMAWMMLEPMLRQMMPAGMMPGMLMSNRNLFSQMRLRRDLEAQATSQTSAAAIDQARMFEQLRSMAAVMGTGFNPEAGRMAVSDMGPLMRMMAGVAPDMYEAGLGWRGSAEIMARNTWMASRYMRDPVTGASRLSGESLNELNREFYDRFYGATARPGDSVGISAGRAGALLNELVGRGYGPPSLSRQQMLTSMGSTPGGSDNLRRMAAEFAPDGSDTGGMASGLAEAVERLSNVTDNPRLDQALRSFNGQRVADFFGRFNRTFAAVQDMLADMGVSNASPGQMIATLNALTQSSINGSTPEALTMRVARAQQMSSYGISLSTVLQAGQFAGSLTDQLGLRRSLAPALGDAGILYARAGYLGSFAGVPGSMDPEQAGAYFVGRAAEAASSNVAGQVAAIVQMGRYATNDGSLHPNMQAYMEAVRNRRTTFTMTDPTGARVTRSIYFRDEGDAAEFVRSSGGDTRLFQSVRNDSNGLQAIINEERIGETVMRMGYDEDARADIERIFSAEVGGTLPDMRDRIGVLAAQAMGNNRHGNTIDATNAVISHVMSGLAADGVTLNPTQRRELEDRLRTAYTDSSVAFRNMGYVPLNMTFEQWLQGNSADAALEADRASRTVDARAAMSVAMQGLGSGSILSRMMTLLETGPADMETGEVIGRILGAVPDAEAAARLRPMMEHVMNRRREAEAHIAAGRFEEARAIVTELQPLVNDLSTFAGDLGLERLETTELAAMRAMERRAPARSVINSLSGLIEGFGISAPTISSADIDASLAEDDMRRTLTGVTNWVDSLLTSGGTNAVSSASPVRIVGGMDLTGTLTVPGLGELEAALRALSPI